MAELGSHQFDAAGIFCTSQRSDGKKALPLSVSAVGGRYIFPYDREVRRPRFLHLRVSRPGIRREDPAEDKKIGVTYSSINGNGFGGYGEVVMGTKGTLMLRTSRK